MSHLLHNAFGNDSGCVFCFQNQMIALLRNATNNLNQVAKKANSTGSIYGADIADMQAKQDEIWETAKEILAGLATIQ